MKSKRGKRGGDRKNRKLRYRENQKSKKNLSNPEVDKVDYGEDQTQIFNLSGHPLTKEEESLLKRGFNFAPTGNYDTFSVYLDLQKFVRKLTLKKFFHEKGDNDQVQSGESICFRPQSTFYPKYKKGNYIETFERMVTQELHMWDDKSLKKGRMPTQFNLSKEERLAMETLKKRKDLILKLADRGGGIVVMNKTDYIAEINRQLSDKKTYVPLKADPTNKLQKKLDDLLAKYVNKGTIT